MTYPNRAIRRRTTSRAKRLLLDARALQRRIKKHYKDAENLQGYAAVACDAVEHIVGWVERELELSRTGH
jgi:hypothetical protein